MVAVAGSSEIRIVPFENQYASDFARLNYEWIDKYFPIEPHDRELLENPFQEIILPGGQIFFAKEDEIVAGTVAMIRYDRVTFELSKMAVTPVYQGKGIADRLMEECVRFAGLKNANRIFLETYSVLESQSRFIRNTVS
jgi:GNAT superfamily N-acetyltransferase